MEKGKKERVETFVKVICGNFFHGFLRNGCRISIAAVHF